MTIPVTGPIQPTPQQQAQLDNIRRQWQQKKRIADHFSKIGKTLAVYSGKGGVGKTTVAINLAVMLANRGAKVGILDADIDCPNVVKAMKADLRPGHNEDGELFPEPKWGVKVLSMGFFQRDEEEAIVWRGPMIHNAITQFLEKTNWGELDYLITDLPPGTSDAPLTLMQTLPIDGFIVVTTPQELSKIDAKRSINMIKKLNTRILGVIENFAGDVFGSGAGEELSREMELPFLGRLNLLPDYRDTEKPTVLLSNKVREEYQNVVEQVVAALSVDKRQSES